ncbi:MAG TPA: 6-phosphogluconolactonase [Verrucomicrobiae bacterium]|nr:6-phosphogluconolactonase [Verrucomicrobiae bacterium]
MANIELIQFSGADELAKTVAEKWLDEIESAKRAGKTHHVALSGGRIAQKFFAETVAQNEKRKISFERVHFFWADERCVPPDDSESNFRTANELLFQPLNVSASQIHRLMGEASPEMAIKLAESDIHIVARNNNGVPVLDLVLLGMGEDGHVASLFQNAIERIANCNDFFLFVPDSPKPPPHRISVNVNVIAAAAQVWVMASGDGKEFALRRSLDRNGNTPLARVIQLRAETKIFTDVGLK